MILPIYILGHTVLKQKAKAIAANHPNLSQLIQDMFETMENANGVGLAAPQVGLPIRLFIIDAEQYDEKFVGMRKVFINAEILERTGEEWSFNEGCLSIPDVRSEVMRPSNIKIKYYDENFVEHIEEFDDIPSRIIQHEYDHIEGILFLDHVSAFKKTLLRRKIEGLLKGKAEISYPVFFAPQKK